jgi:glutamine amidotransferase
VCRHLAYLGPLRDLATLLLDPPHSLLRQSYAPADMRGGGTINADGFGAGWYPDGARTPIRYRRAVPVGMPVVDTACAPFSTGRWLFSHNGVVAGWPDSVAALASRLPVTELLTLEAPTDSALLWALVHHQLAAGASPGCALGVVTAHVRACAPGSRLNLLLTDGTELAATAVHHALAVRVGDGGVLVCSEPTDQSSGWEPVPDCHLLTATPSTVDVVPIPATTAEEP